MAEINEIDYSSVRQDRRSRPRRKIFRNLLLLLLLFLLGLAGYWFWQQRQMRLSEPQNLPQNRATGYDRIDNPVYLPLEPFTVNLADRRHYVRATIVLLLSEEAAAEFLQTRLPEVRDVILSELQTLSTDQLVQIGERTLLRGRLLNRIASLLPDTDYEWNDPAPLKRLLITEFYLQ